MSQWNDQFSQMYGSRGGTLVVDAAASERAAFIRRTYLHLAGAIAAFGVLEAVLLNLPGIDRFILGMFGSPWSLLVVLGLFMGASWLANSWAQSATSPAKQYAGLGLYVVVEAIVFLPILYVAQNYSNSYQAGNIIATAGLVTLLIVAGLSAFAFLSGADFSFLRGILVVGGFASIGVVIAALIFGFQLGIFFSGAMIVLASGYILYDTSNIIHHYRTDQHVSAALALFASVALLFFYVLRLLMELQRER